MQKIRTILGCFVVILLAILSWQGQQTVADRFSGQAYTTHRQETRAQLSDHQICSVYAPLNHRIKVRYKGGEPTDLAFYSIGVQSGNFSYPAFESQTYYVSFLHAAHNGIAHLRGPPTV